MKKKLPKYQVGNSNPCGPGTIWDDVQKKCIPAQVQNTTPIDPVFAATQNMVGYPFRKQGSQWQQIQNGQYQPVSVNPVAQSGYQDSRGTDLTFGQYNADALSKGFNYDSDGKYRKTETTEIPNSLGYSDGFKALNVGLDLTRFLAGTVNDVNTNKKERRKYLKALQQDERYNSYEQGLNNVPAYFQVGGSPRKVDKVPEGYTPLPNRPNYFHNPQQSFEENYEVTGAAPNDGPKMSNADWVKFVANKKAKQTNDIVYIEPSVPTPVQAFSGQPIYNENKHAIGMYKFAKRNTDDNTQVGQSNLTRDVLWSDIDKMGNPIGDIITIPDTEFSKATRGLETLYDPTIINKYRKPTLQKGGNINNTGYTPGTASYNNPYNIIPSNDITMENTPFDVMAYPNNGQPTLMKAGGKYKFPGADYVTEVPMQQGGYAQPNAELEQGEVFQTQQGEITKVPESHDRHEQGGSMQANVQRVLEDTADKRKDKDSKYLRITPDEAETLVDFRPKKYVSHSKLYEQAKEKNDSKLKSLEKKLKDNMDYIKYSNGGKFAQNSLDENLKIMDNFTTNGEIFDIIYSHQEQVKAKYAIDQEQKAMQKGGVPKYQTGSYGSLTPWAGDKYQNKKNASMYSKDDWGKKLIAKGYKGDFSNLDVQKFLYTTPQGKSIIDNLHTTKPGTIYGDPAQNRYDEKLGYRWDAALDAVPDLATPPVVQAPAAPVIPEVTTVIPNLQEPNRKYDFTGDGGSGLNRFNEPLRWYDTMPKVASYLSSLGRTPVDLEQLQYNPLKVHEESALPLIMQNQGDFNAGLDMLPTNGVGFANQANLMGNKYAVNQQGMAGVESRNKQRYNQIDATNAQGQMQIDATNLQLRDQFNNRILQGKEIQRQSKLNAFDDFATMVAQNRKLNREGNLVLELTPYFDQNGQFNGRKYVADANVKELANKTGYKNSVETINGKTYAIRRNAKNEIVSQTETTMERTRTKSVPTK